MPRKTQGEMHTIFPRCPGFNEAAARCRGKLTVAGTILGTITLLQ